MCWSSCLASSRTILSWALSVTDRAIFFRCRTHNYLSPLCIVRIRASTSPLSPGALVVLSLLVPSIGTPNNVHVWSRNRLLELAPSNGLRPCSLYSFGSICIYVILLIVEYNRVRSSRSPPMTIWRLCYDRACGFVTVSLGMTGLRLHSARYSWSRILSVVTCWSACELLHTLSTKHNWLCVEPRRYKMKPITRPPILKETGWSPMAVASGSCLG